MRKNLKNLLISLGFLIAACALCLALRQIDNDTSGAQLVFVLAILLISRFTDGYVWGVLASILSVIAVNYAFTYPYFRFNLSISGYLITFITMLAVSLIVSVLTSRIKRQEHLRIEAERERLRTDLLRAVSHDLRTPLTSIYSATSVLREGKNTLTEAQKDAMLLNIQKDSEWLIRMVENLLSVTRIENETMKISKTPTILDELIDSSVAKFSQRHPNQKVDVTVPEDIVVVSVDSILIEQVILNLLENAVCHAEGMTTLALNVFTTADQVVFEVLDDGCGIDEDKLKTLFSGCYEGRQDMTHGTRRYAGIGLSVCYTIVKAHGGTIAAENRKNGGAAFRFTVRREKTGDDEQ